MPAEPSFWPFVLAVAAVHFEAIRKSCNLTRIAHYWWAPGEFWGGVPALLYLEGVPKKGPPLFRKFDGGPLAY